MAARSTSYGLVVVVTRCHGGCGEWYTREIEPEWADVIRQHGQCDDCYGRQERTRDTAAEAA